jgi:hypothetical protein
MTVELTDAAKDRLIEIGFDPTLGARPLRRAMQREVEDQLSERILHGELNPGDHVKVDAEGGKFLFEHGPRGEKVAVGVGCRRDRGHPGHRRGELTRARTRAGCRGIGPFVVSIRARSRPAHRAVVSRAARRRPARGSSASPS